MVIVLGNRIDDTDSNTGKVMCFTLATRFPGFGKVSNLGKRKH